MCEHIYETWILTCSVLTQASAALDIERQMYQRVYKLYKQLEQLRILFCFVYFV